MHFTKHLHLDIGLIDKNTYQAVHMMIQRPDFSVNTERDHEYQKFCRIGTDRIRVTKYDPSTSAGSIRREVVDLVGSGHRGRTVLIGNLFTLDTEKYQF